MHLLSIKKIFILTIIIVCIRSFVIIPILKFNLKKISRYEEFSIARNGNSCISNRKHDGSETLISSFNNKNIKSDLNLIIFLSKLYVGPESRVYIYIKKQSPTTSVIELQTSKMWRNSILYLGDIHLIVR